MSDYDIVVVGAGMVGTAVGCLFGASGARVALIEASSPAAVADDERIDLRVSAVSPASQRLLTRIGAWQRIDRQRRCAYLQMRVWDASAPPASDAVLQFDSAEAGTAELGHIVENRRIVAALHECLSAMPNIELYSMTRVEGVESDWQRASVMLEGGQRITTRLIVGADGAGSQTRELAGIATGGHSYQQRAVVTHIQTALPHRQIAYQRFMPTGPIALLPLHDGRCSIVWSTTAEQAQILLDLDETEFRRAVHDASDGVLGEVRHSDARAAFALSLKYARDYVRPRIALVGDAAHTVHPLAGQGVNMGFADAQQLHQTLESGADPGDFGALRRYERAAKSRNLAMMSALDGLHRLFTTPAPLVTRLRSAGLALVNRSGPVKLALIRRAIGI